MNNASHKNTWNWGMTQIHVEPPPNPLIKSKHANKSDRDLVKLKFCRDPTSSSSDLYEFKLDFFDNIDTQEFLLFMQKFNMALAASGTLDMGTKIQYICTLVCG